MMIFLGSEGAPQVSMQNRARLLRPLLTKLGSMLTQTEDVLM